MTWTIVCADVLDWAREYDGPKFHACLCDPPYGLGQPPDMAEVLTHWLNGDDYEHQGGGFMQRSWDAFVPGPKVWAALRAHCHPGAYLFAFGGTRTADLLSIAIRLGGWERFDEIDWVYASGFPKSHNISKAIDKVAGVERTEFDTRPIAYPDSNCWGKPNSNSVPQNFGIGGSGGKKQNTDGQGNIIVSKPATDLARIWDGYGTALKPAHEPILCFRNPLVGTYAENCVVTGAGALWIDGARIGTDWKTNPTRRGWQGKTVGWMQPGAYDGLTDRATPKPQPNSQGRWPANLLLCHVGPHECPSCDGTGRNTWEQWMAGARDYGGTRREWDDLLRDTGEETIECGNCNGTGLVGGCQKRGTRRVGSGIPKITARQRMAAWRRAEGRDDLPVADALAVDNYGLEEVADWECEPSCAVRMLGEQSGESRSDNRQPTGRPKYTGSDVDSVAMRTSSTLDTTERGHTDKGTAARFFHQSDWTLDVAEQLAAAEPVRYVAKAGRAERQRALDDFYWRKEVSPIGFVRISQEEWETLPEKERAQGNIHSTVKPLRLLEYLARLLLPPAEYAPRRILVPFAGSGSEMVGCGLAGWEEIVGIEMNEEYVAIAEARCQFWQGMTQQTGLSGPQEILRVHSKGNREKPGPAQLSLGIYEGDDDDK